MDPQSMYRQHQRHLEIRRKDRSFWELSCPACKLHKEAEEKANREIKERTATKDQAWWRNEQ